MATHTEKRIKTLRCCNPFKKSNHSNITKGLRTVMPWMHSFIEEIQENSKVCDSCRKEFSKLRSIGDRRTSNTDLPSTSQSDLQVESESESDDDDDIDKDVSFTNKSEALKSFNASLMELGESPIVTKKAEFKKYSSEKAKKISSKIKRKFLPNAAVSSDEEESLNDELVSHLIKTYRNCENRTKKIMLLTLVPESWSIRKTVKLFEAPNYQVRQAKNLLKERGILSTPNQRPGKTLPTQTANDIKQFYESDEVSRSMPGIKDCVSMKDNDGNKVKVSKRLILCNLKEAYKLFQEKNSTSNTLVSFSKFAELRPKNCILAGQSGTHSVCVCTIHQNVKLMIENSKMSTATAGQFANYKDFLSKMVCNPASIDCHFSNCDACPGTDDIRKILEDGFENQCIETVTFRQWISVDRCNLETLQKSISEFLDNFISSVIALLRHDFIAKQQSSFMTHIKENLSESDVLVVCDFAENYSFVLQDEAQSYHWNNAQATFTPL